MPISTKLLRLRRAAPLFLAVAVSFAASAATPPKPDKIKVRRDALELSLVPAEPIPQLWLQEPIRPAQVIFELEQAWSESLKQEPPVENRPGKKNHAERSRERDETVERRDVFLACLDKDKKDHMLFRFNGGPGKPFGYVIFKKDRAVYWYRLGVNPAQ